MSQYDDYNTFDFTHLKVSVDKILNSINKSTLKEIANKHGQKYLQANYCYHHPDVLCTILKTVYGRSYIEMIKINLENENPTS
jgi:hypothetical protein